MVKHKKTEKAVANTVEQKPWQFQKGRSGNPDGKPKGTRHKATQAASLLLEGELDVLTRKAIEMALEGDTTALRLCLERIIPPLKSTTPAIRLNTPLPETLTGKATAFVDAAAAGDIPADVAAQMVSALANIARVEEIETLKQRMEALEQTLKEQRK
jgi:hypothetical protein